MSETETTQELPVKGTIWRHARRTDYAGNPLELTVTSITNGRVYSVDKYRDRVKTPVELWSRMCAEIVSVPLPEPKPVKMTDSECADLFQRAHTIGNDAAGAIVPTPMHVVERADPLDDSSEIVRRYPPVMDGVCGFAWVNVRGNTSFARWLRKTGKGRTDSYAGGTQIWVSHFGQSYERKSAYARAFAEYLRNNGVKAYAGSRLD